MGGLRAPPTPGGPHSFKVSLLGTGWQITDPAGVGNFAAITASTHAKSLSVVADPVTAFAMARLGLPLPTTPYYNLAIVCGDFDLMGKRLGGCARAFVNALPRHSSNTHLTYQSDTVDGAGFAQFTNAIDHVIDP